MLTRRKIILLRLPIFRFSQLEVPWLLGPPDGRYLVRVPVSGSSEAEPVQVLVFTTLAAPRRPGRFAGRRRAAPPAPEPAPVSTSRVTVIDAANPFPDESTASKWLDGAREEDLTPDLRSLAEVLQTFRAITADAHVRVPTREQLLVARIGYGEGEQVAYGQWAAAQELLPATPRQRRAKLLEPQARLASALNQRLPLLLCEELALRARLDFDSERFREAALQVTVALDAALAQLQPQMAHDMDDRITELALRIDPITAAASAALTRELDSGEREAVGFALTRIEAALRARAAATY